MISVWTPYCAIHDQGFVDFPPSRMGRLARLRVSKAKRMPTVWPARRMTQRIPTHIEGRLGYYALACETTISDGTWEAALCVGASRLDGGAAPERRREGSVFPLPPTRPSCRNRHVWRLLFYQQRRGRRAAFSGHRSKRVAILDVDFHHGNGTQDIF